MLWRFGAEYRKGSFRRPFDDLEQRARRSTRRTFALFPVTHGFHRHTDPRRKSGLRQPGLPAHIPRIGGFDEAGVCRCRAPLTCGACAPLEMEIGPSLPSGRISTKRPSAFNRTRSMALSSSVSGCRDSIADLVWIQ